MCLEFCCFIFRILLLQVEERGPFIYLEKVRKVDVRWVKNTVEFHDYKQQTFDPLRTQQFCPDCQEQEMVRIFN